MRMRTALGDWDRRTSTAPPASRRASRRAIAWVVVALMLANAPMVAPTAHAVDAQTQGRKHSRRAAQLAAANKCSAAIPEYGKALALLKDPALFFNRGECYRRIDDRPRALADYQSFLREMPNAPNRAQVAVRIAELESAAAGTSPAPPGTPPPTSVIAAPPATPSRPVTSAPPVTQAPSGAPTSPGSARAPGTAPSPRSGQAPAEPAPPPTRAPSTPAAPSWSTSDRPMESTVDLSGTESRVVDTSPRPMFAEPHITMVDGDPPSGRSGADSIARRWWFWTVIGVVLIGGGVAAYLVAKPEATEVPLTGLGNYTF